MDPATISYICLIALFVFMMLGVPIAYSLGFSAMVAGILVYGIGVMPKVGWGPFHTLFTFSWTPLPLFVLLGSIIAETDIGRDLFHAASKWFSRIPGGLIVSGIVGEAIMASTMGISSACAIVVGKTAVPEFDRAGYDRGLSLGALLAGGVLGPLIPPSASMIIYAVLANVSLGKIFIAGIVPGVLLALFLITAAILISWRRPHLAAPVSGTSWSERFVSLKKVWPVVIIILGILGAIYFGIATPTETAGIGVIVTFVLAIAFYKLRWNGLRKALIEAATVNSMVLFMLIGAALFTYIIGSANIAKYLEALVHHPSISPWMVIVAINIVLLVLGCIIDPITITLLSVPIFVPAIISLGYDPIWFGVVFVVNTQIGLITPPMGIDLFAIKTVFDIPTGEILRGVIPFVIVEIIFLGIIVAFPILSLCLPSMMIG
jgi:C4-dicarboxylate transporter DctM subunit